MRKIRAASEKAAAAALQELVKKLAAKRGRIKIYPSVSTFWLSKRLESGKTVPQGIRLMFHVESTKRLPGSERMTNYLKKLFFRHLNANGIEVQLDDIRPGGREHQPPGNILFPRGIHDWFWHIHNIVPPHEQGGD